MSNQFRIMLSIVLVTVAVMIMKPIAKVYEEYLRIRSRFQRNDEEWSPNRKT